VIAITTVYFIRHAESDSSVHEGRTRPLTEKGLKDRALVTSFLLDKNIDAVLSSPFKRAVDTVSDFADGKGLQMVLIEDFKEHDTISDNYPTSEYFSFINKYWTDFNYKVHNDESLFELQKRNITAFNRILAEYRNKTVVIGTHGMALSTIINYFDPTYKFENFLDMVKIKPWVVRMDFNDDGCVGMEKIDLFHPGQKPDIKKCKVYTVGLGMLKAYRYTVIFARHNEKWLYCRAKERDTFETAGGHIEPGETPLDGAKRELYEETGAISFDITPLFDYSVHYPSVYSNGQVFYARIDQLGDLPDYEMAEVKLYDEIPDKMRFPEILPVLFRKVRECISIRSKSNGLSLSAPILSRDASIE